MSVWLQIWGMILHGLFAQSLPFPGPGAASGDAIPVRGSSCQTTNAASIVWTFPTGTIVGDSVVLFVAAQTGVVVPTGAGWDILQGIGTSANWSNGAAMYKVMTSGDISTGSVSVGSGATGGMVACGETFVGTVGGIREVDFTYANAATASVGLTTSSQVLSTDHALIFASARASANPTSSVGTLAHAINNGSNAAASLFDYSPSGGAFTATEGYTGYNTAGYYQAIVVVELVSSVPPSNVWFSQDCITFVSSVCGTLSDGTNLSTWADRSGNANTATVATGTATFHTAQINGQGAVTCTSCGFTWANGVDGPSQYTIFAVYKTTVSGVAYALTGCSVSTTGCFGYSTGATKQNRIDISDVAQVALGNAAQNTSWHQTNLQYSSVSPNNYVFRIDRTADGNGVVGNSTSNPVKGMLYVPHDGGGFLNGQLAELIFYAGNVLSNTQRTQVENYLNAKYGL